MTDGMLDAPVPRGVGVVGLGLIGGSVALDLAGDGEVLAWDVDGDHRAAAAAQGITIADSVDDLARRCEVVVVAVPAAAVATTLTTIAAAAPGRIVTDVTSVKAPVAMGLTEPPDLRFVGGHPMAGTERSGFAAARRGLLAGATWMLTPDPDVDRAALATVLRLVLRLGATPVVVDAVAHDHLVAAVSHVPHLLAFALHGTASGLGSEVVDLVAGPSFRDATRVAASPPETWADILHRNRAAIGDVLDELRAWLEDAVAAARTDATDTLADLLTAARRAPLPSSPLQERIALHAPDAVERLRELGRRGCAIVEVAGDAAATEVVTARR